MSRRKKNAGKGYGMMFHGSFSSKEDAKKKERKVHGFIQPTTIKGERRYTVMSERKNPIRRKKKNKNPMDLVVMGANPHGDKPHEIEERLKEIDRIEQMERDGIITKKEKFEYLAALHQARAHHRGNAAREVVVHPGETITLKVNPSAAEEIREEFTGREADQVDVYDEPHMQAGSYSKLGDLMGITYKPVGGGQVQAIGWYEGSERIPLHEAAKTLRRLTEAPVLVSATNRRQLYFVSGNQDVSPLGVSELGEARSIVYRERKHFDDFALINYQHNFGEENGKRPTLFYDAGKKRLLLEGGDYEVRPEGITN